MLPDYLTSYNPLKERLSGKNSSADQQKIKTALQQILDGKGGGPEFGAVMGSAEAKALRMLGGNTGRFAGNYVLKNYDKLDPMVKDMVPLYGKDIVETEGALEKQKEMPVLPRVVESARRRQSERRAKAVERQEAKKLTLDEIRRKHKKAVREEPDGGVSQEGAYEEEFINSFVGRPAKKRRAFSASQNPDTENDMDNIGYQEGGMVPVDGEGNMPPEAVASDVVNGAPMGMVDVPNGGGPVDDGVPTELPEGTVVINAAAIRLHGTETIDNLINTAVDELLSEGVQISMQDPNPNDNVPVAISNGEYVIPPEVAEKIGYKKLEDMNERGRAYLQKQAAQEKQQAEAQQQPQQPTQQPPESFMGESMPPQQEGPPPAPVQSEQQAMAMMGMMDGGRVPYAAGGGGGIGATARVQAPVAPTAPAVATAEAPAPSNIISQAKDKFTGWFTETFLGGSMDPAPSAVNAMGMLPQKTPEEASGRTKAKPDRGASFKSAVDPLYDSTLAELGPTTQFRSNVQRAAEGGFVGDYNYAQPQQATMGTPFPNAVDSSPQQSQSFLQPNDAKKKSRVELANGTTSHDGSLEILPFPNDPREKDKKRNREIQEAFAPKSAAPEPTPEPISEILSSNNSFVDVQPSEGGFEQADNQVKEELGNDPIFAYEIAGGSLKDLQKILSGELSTNISRKAFDGFYLKRYMDNASTPNPTIGGMNLNTLEKDEKELKNKEKISLAEYLPYHRKRLEKANAWVDTKIKENSNSEESYEKARDILVDMHFNLGAGGLNKFKKMIRAIGEGDWSKATREIGKKAGGAGNNEYLQVHKRVKGKDVPQVNSDGSPKLIERAVRNKEKLAALIQKPRAKPTPPPREIAIPRSKPKQPQASGGFISLEEGGVAERASSESKGSFYESRQSGFEKLHEQALDLADVRRKQLKGNTLAQGSGNKELDENYQAEFDSLIKNMTYEITAGTESVGGFTKKTSAEEREKLVDQLTAFYEGKANEGITERESLHLDFKEDFNNMPGSERMAEADINMDRTMSKNPDKNPSRQTRAVPNILEQEGSEAYTGFLTPDFNPLATQRNI